MCDRREEKEEWIVTETNPGQDTSCLSLPRAPQLVIPLADERAEAVM